jgi:hypothetical protein
MSYLARGPIVMGIDSKANGMRLPTHGSSISFAGGEARTMSYLARGPIVMGIDSKANGMRCRRPNARVSRLCRRQPA